MARKDVSAHDRAQRSRPVYWEMMQAQYVHPGVATDGASVPVDGSLRYIAVPPVPNTIGPTLGSLAIRRPDEMWLYRANDFYMRMDTAADTRNGAWLVASIVHKLPINPGVNTLSFVSVVNTDLLRLNWLWSI